MKSQEDYIERTIVMMRQMLAQIIKLRAAGEHEQAMRVLLQAQEKLFSRSPSAVTSLALDDQLALLVAGLSRDEAREKFVGYALLFREAGLSYWHRDRQDLAAAAFKSALYVLLRASLASPGRDEALVDLIRSTLAATPLEQIDAPIIEMLESTGSGLRQ
jgi:hypothetical protein